METLIEGMVSIRVPLSNKLSKKMEVFYNPEKRFDRDLSVELLRVWASKKKEVSVCDLLSGTGIRGLRYAVEVKNTSFIVMNDLNAKAYETIKKNVEMNREKIDGKEVLVENMDANKFLLSKDLIYDVIDVDPFGTPLPFIESSISRLRFGGLLMVTATDTAPLSGRYPFKCFARYFSNSGRCEFYPEMAMRILVKRIVEKGSEKGCAMVPILVYWGGNYIRAFFVKSRKSKLKSLLSNVGYLYNCRKCLRKELSKFNETMEMRCPSCMGRRTLFGPLYLGRMLDREMAEGILSNTKNVRIKSLITTLILEDELNVPFFYTTDSIASKLSIDEPKIELLIEKMRKSGLRAVRVHSLPKGFKVDASIEEVKRLFIDTVVNKR
ncbi:MAG: tRNA (guanine(10)-N(2))-dimethyltransferase [Candidatus Asgardarchaeia archaeon]